MLRTTLSIWLALIATSAAADLSGEIKALAGSGQLSAALAKAEIALRQTPQDARLRFEHALVLQDMGLELRALQAFVAMTHDFPQLPEPHNNIAALHGRAGRWEQARESLETALRNDPTHALARENLGDVYLQLALQSWQMASSNGASLGATPQGAAAPGALLRNELQRKIRLARQLATSSLFTTNGTTNGIAPSPVSGTP